jgi:hypothetical protein
MKKIHVNIGYTYCKQWSLKEYLKKELSHIEKILYYPFKLKYLNPNVFYPILKKHDFFSWKHRVYI